MQILLYYSFNFYRPENIQNKNWTKNIQKKETAVNLVGSSQKNLKDKNYMVLEKLSIC